MHSVKEKVSNAVVKAAARTKEEVSNAAEKPAAKTKEEKTIAEERRKAKEAEAKMELHQAKARHAAEKLQAKQAHLGIGGHHHIGPTTVVGQGHHDPVGTTIPTTGTVAPAYPLGGYPPHHGHI